MAITDDKIKQLAGHLVNEVLSGKVIDSTLSQYGLTEDEKITIRTEANHMIDEFWGEDWDGGKPKPKF